MVFIKILLYLWQLPQNLLGLLLIKLYKAQFKEIYKNRQIYRSLFMNGSISLGKYIILSFKGYESLKIKKHEYGHTIQSLYLGWLYLIIIGLPSIIWCWSYNTSRDYYSFWTEAWANRLGGN